MFDEWTVSKEIPSELLPAWLNYLSAEKNYRRISAEQKGKGISIDLINAGIEAEYASDEYHTAVNELMRKGFKRGK
ncbi:hypothetical protein HY837_06615 [archaeon]|nr:hypothetical protein [archaeon]